MKNTLFLLILASTLIACSKNDDRLKEKAALEGESSTTSAVRVENDNLAKKAEKMELDLAKRHRFYQAVKGSYEGTFETHIGTTKIALDLTPSKAPFPITRVRQLDEISKELDGLNLTAHVVLSDVNDSNASVGCANMKVADDIIHGELAISSDTCPNLYLIKISEKGYSSSSVENSEAAIRIARQVLEGDVDEIDSINGSYKTSSYASKFKFVATKVRD